MNNNQIKDDFSKILSFFDTGIESIDSQFMEGEEYALFLKQLVENEFHTMLSDFENDVNPFDEEATKYKLPRHEESIKKRCRKLEERIEDIKEGEKTGNHRKEE